MRSALLLSFAALAVSACLNAVDERWCDTAQPCSPGYLCTADFHCILAPFDAGVGGAGGHSGGGSGGGTGGGFGGGTGGGFGGGTGGGFGGGTGGGFGGGTGGGFPFGGGAGGGGGASCDAQSCAIGCCLSGVCVQPWLESDATCGTQGQLCHACPPGTGCGAGQCVPNTSLDGGTSPIGGACVTDAQCGSDGLSFCLTEPNGFPGGYCSRSCDAVPCPTGQCVQVQDPNGQVLNVCFSSCMGSLTCRMGYSCQQNFCLPI